VLCTLRVAPSIERRIAAVNHDGDAPIRRHDRTGSAIQADCNTEQLQGTELNKSTVVSQRTRENGSPMYDQGTSAVKTHDWAEI